MRMLFTFELEIHKFKRANEKESKKITNKIENL